MCVCVVLCLRGGSLPPSIVDDVPSHPFSVPPAPSHASSGPQHSLALHVISPGEGLCVFWLNDSLHISSPTLSPLEVCTSAPFPLLAHGAFFSGSVSSSASPAPTPARPSLHSLTALHFPPPKHSSRASVTCEIPSNLSPGNRTADERFLH